MPNLFGVDIAGQLAQALGGQLVPGVLTKITPGTRTPGDPLSGTNPVRVSYNFEGFYEVSKDSKYISILTKSLPNDIVPQETDQLRIEGVIYNILSDPSRDPAEALYMCKVEEA